MLQGLHLRVAGRASAALRDLISTSCVLDHRLLHRCSQDSQATAVTIGTLLFDLSLGRSLDIPDVLINDMKTDL